MTKPQNNLIQHRAGLRWLALILILFCELMAHTWVRTESTQSILRISKTQAEIHKRLSYRKALGLELDRLKSDSRITRIARSRLGLSTDIFNQTIYLPGNVN